MQDRADHGNVFQLDAVARVTQHQAAARHVAPTDERRRKTEPLAEDPGEHVDVFRRRDAAEQHDVAVGPDLRQQRACAHLQRPAIAGIRRVDVAAGKGADRRVGDARVGGAESGIRCDDVHAVADDGIARFRRAREPPRIRELAAEVETADEGEEFAERRAVRRAQRRRQRERRLRRERLLRTPAITVGWREQKYAMAGVHRSHKGLQRSQRVINRLTLRRLDVRQPQTPTATDSVCPLYTFVPVVRSATQKPQRSSTEPTVKPAPTDARSTRFPFLSRPLHTASFSARGMVAAVVFPKFSMLIITLLESMPSFSVADWMMRRFAWCETNRSISAGVRPLRSRTRRAISSVLRTANLNTVAPSCFT